MAVTSNKSPLKTNSGEIIYTATQVVGPSGRNPPKYTTAIVKYDTAGGENPRTIATTNSAGKITWTEDASNEDKLNAALIRSESRNQVESVKQDVYDNLSDKQKQSQKKYNDALDKSSGNDNKQRKADQTANAMSLISQSNAKGTNEEKTREDKFGFHVFPESIRITGGEGDQDFLKIDMMKYAPKELGREGNSNSLERLGFSDRDPNRQSIGAVILPIPGGIRDNNQVSWSKDDMSALQIAASDIALATIERGVGAGIDATGANMQAALNSPDLKRSLSRTLAGMAAGSNRLMTRTTGAIMNPNMELLFDSPSLRQFSFNFILSPRSQKETQTIVKIIRFFKQGMAPIRSKSRLFLRSPHTFRLAYKHKTKKRDQLNPLGSNQKAEKNNPKSDHRFLNKFKECALLGFGVDYTPNGQYSTYRDGSMTAYRITMSFQELTPIYNDDYGDGDEFTTSTPEIGF